MVAGTDLWVNNAESFCGSFLTKLHPFFTCEGNFFCLPYHICTIVASEVNIFRYKTWHWLRMSKCQKCREEEEAGMACLSCPCSSTFATTTSGTVDRSTAALDLKDLAVLDMMQLQNLCVKGNLVPSGNRATLIDRLLDRFYHPQQEFSVLIIWLLTSIFLQLWPKAAPANQEVIRSP